MFAKTCPWLEHMELNVLAKMTDIQHISESKFVTNLLQNISYAHVRHTS